MINFEFTDEENVFRNTVREFGEKKIVPVVRKIDDDAKIPEDIIEGLAELGLWGMTFSSDVGGAEADPILTGIAAEELGRADISCSIPVFFLVPNSWGYILDKYGNDELRKEALPKVTKGKGFCGIATTESGAGSDLGSMRTVAIKSGDKYVINGEKMFISGIDETVNQLPDGGGYVTLVKTDPSRGTRGMSLFYIPFQDDDGKLKEGITPTLVDDWGRRGMSTGGFGLQDIELEKKYLIGEENRGFYISMEGFDYARVLIAAVCCGCAQSALEYGIEYIKQRKVFGKPIGKYEGIQFKLAEHWAKIDAVRTLTYRALWMFREEQKEKAFTRFEVSKVIAESKMLAVTFAFDAINDAIQWLGAFGYTKDSPLDLALRGARSYGWAEGSTEIMKIIVARELLGKEFLPYR
jgi:acyl-CoA dehydrogenase